MKKITYLLFACSILLASCSPKVYVSNTPPPARPMPPPAPSENSFQIFYDALSPYGNWINYPGEGYVWVPNVGPDFRPYATNGHWVYSDAGWTWISNYSWGWAPFHYGRWFYEANYGWMWLPGHEWAPAWVTWGRSGNYYGWAPIAPHVNLQAGSWTPPNDSWNFVPAEHINKPNVVNYVVNNNKTVVNNTTIVKNVTIINNVTNNITNNNVNNNTTNVTNNHITNVVYNKGPEVNEVENVSNVKIQRITLNEKAAPGAAILNGSQLSVYRPVIKPNAKPGGKEPAPAKSMEYHRANQ